jgi:hypothetical protein
MTKPRTAPRGGKPHTAPEHGHAVLTEAEQAKFLGRGNEVVSNLGHPSRESDLTKHPLNKVQNYDSGDTARTFRDPPRLQGVYTKCNDPKSGISAEQNIDAWAKRATANSYTGHGNKAGVGKDPTMPDPRGRHSNESDGYLARSPNPSTDNWASFRAGSESGEGRLEKLHRK